MMADWQPKVSTRSAALASTGRSHSFRVHPHDSARFRTIPHHAVRQPPPVAADRRRRRRRLLVRRRGRQLWSQQSQVSGNPAR